MDRNTHLGTNTGHLINFSLSTHQFSIPEAYRNLELKAVNDIAVFEGFLWIATDAGLIALNQNSGATTRYLTTNSPLSQNQVDKLRKDKEVMWIGTYLGLDLISPSAFALFNTLNSGISNDIMSFAEDSRNRLWVSTFTGLYFREKESSIHYPISSLFPLLEIKDANIMSSAVIEDELWLGFKSKGLQIIDLATGASVKPSFHSSAGLGITTILHTSTKETWVGTHRDGLYRFRGKTVFSHHGDDVKSGYAFFKRAVTSLLETNTGTILVGTEDGLLEYDAPNSRFSEIEVDNTETDSDPLILSIIQSQNDSIWVGTLNQGLYKKSGFQSENESPFILVIPNITVYSIAIDDEDNLWASTTQGLIQFDSEGTIL